MQPFDSLVDEHGPTVLRVCRALLGVHDADEAWSETFLAALRAYPALKDTSNLRGWLVTIAHRKAIDHLRAAKRSAVPMADPPDHGAPDRSSAEHDALRAALAALPDRQRHAVVYRYLGDLSYDDVAALMGCSPAAARRSASDALATLRRLHQKGTL